ncbi:MAG: RidA family protein [Caulobacteraceae bacterium]
MEKYIRETVVTQNAPKGRGPFPQALKVGPFVFLSGWGPLDKETNAPIKGDFKQQVRKTFDNISAVAEASGLSIKKAVKITVYLADLTNIPCFNEIYEEYFPDENQRPARTLVQAGLRGIDVEIDVILMDV